MTMPEELGPHFRAILQYLSSNKELDREDLDFLDAFGRELQRVSSKIKARGPVAADQSSERP